ncbi:MAG: arginine--tRNA ligase [Acidobacteriota bacterium]|jgi:arginyl-tRNA synthetase|nr:arginine--tRNA ligase [Acidobacteriota bacterium]
MLLTITRTLEKALIAKIAETYDIRYESLNFTLPPKIELGELALPVAFELARKVRRPPREIAQELADAAGAIPGIGKVDVAGGGYLNFHLDRGAFTVALAEGVAAKNFGRTAAPEETGKTIVEHTNINPNKAAHIGHLRNATLGDTFVRCLRFLGRQVEVQNYLDNTGVQVADVVVGLERMMGKTLADLDGVEGKFDYFCWDVYAKVSGFYGQSEENKQWRSRTMQLIESGGNATAELAETVAMRVAAAHLGTMARINVHYDLLPRESEILHLKFWSKAYALLKERKAIYFVDSGKNHGCWVMSTAEAEASGDAASSERNGASLPTNGESRAQLEEAEKIIVRSDGTVTYVGKDIAYQLWKFGLLGLDFHYKPYIAPNGDALWITTPDADSTAQPPRFGSAACVYNVIDSRQAYLQNIVRQGLEALGFKAQAEKSVHYSYEMVALTPACCDELGFPLTEEDRKRPYVEVSGRKGLGVKADDLLDALERKALAEVQSRHELPDDEAARIARSIAVGALRYFLLRFARNTVIAFDFKEALSFEGETGPYVQYAAVRAGNIFRKLAASKVDAADADAKEAAPSLTGEHPGLGEFLAENDDIWEIVYQASRLAEVVRQIAETLEMGQLCKYAFSLAQRFNLFYHRHHILSEPDAQKRGHLLLVTDLVRQQLEKALDLLGCEVPPKM